MTRVPSCGSCTMVSPADGGSNGGHQGVHQRHLECSCIAKGRAGCVVLTAMLVSGGSQPRGRIYVLQRQPFSRLQRNSWEVTALHGERRCEDAE